MEMDTEQNVPEPVEVPLELLSPEAIEALIDAFILREGTDYGAHEIALETKRRQVREQLENHRVNIVFDAESESVTLIKAEEWKRKRG